MKKAMKQTLTGLSAAAALAAGATAAAGGEETIVLDLRDFDRIEIAGVYELDVKVGGDYAIELSGDEDELDRVEARVENRVLTLSQKDRRMWNRDTDGVEAEISLPMLVGLEVSGVVEGSIKDIDAESFTLELSGVGDIDLAGECGRFEATVSGVGDLDARSLECAAVAIAVSGVGDASVYARDEVDAKVSGMGDIDVYGSPAKVTKSDSLFADVTIH